MIQLIIIFAVFKSIVTFEMWEANNSLKNMKKLTKKQLDVKFDKAKKLADQLNQIMQELAQGNDGFAYGKGNAFGLGNKVRWVASVLENEKDMHK